MTYDEVIRSTLGAIVYVRLGIADRDENSCVHFPGAGLTS